VFFKSGLEWQLGHILQLSRHNAETRKYDKPRNDQSVEVTKHVGVLCSLYQLSPGTESTFELSKNSSMDYHSLESYVCTLPESCIMNTSKSRWHHHLQPYYKANKKVLFDSEANFYYRRLLEMFIIHNRNFISTSKISPTKRSTSTSSTGAIVIPSNSENDDQTALSIARDLWTRCGGISLGTLCYCHIDMFSTWQRSM